MVTDKQVRKVQEIMEKTGRIGQASNKADMDEKTARKYWTAKKLPSQLKKPHTWQTRTDPFKKHWAEIEQRLASGEKYQVKTLFEHLQDQYPGKYTNGQIRTLQRRIKRWRAENGSPKEVMFQQVHYPGVLSASDFTSMNTLKITIANKPFDHLLYHFVLTYSNWETATICYSESFESVSEGLQRALWELGGTTERHRTDCLSAAVRNTTTGRPFTEQYTSLMRYLGIEPYRTNPSSPHENGDAEKSNDLIKTAIDQALMLRGNRDFAELGGYEDFLRKVLARQNAKRTEKCEEEKKALRALPAAPIEYWKPDKITVGSSSTIRVKHNTYSVNSRLIGEEVSARIHHATIEIWLGQKRLDVLPRVYGECRESINYRHVIEWLVRKPGAFANYRYRAAMFPTVMFRVCYDTLRQHQPQRADKEYLQILLLAARYQESAVEDAINHLLSKEEPIAAARIEALLNNLSEVRPIHDVEVMVVPLGNYDILLSNAQAGL